MTIGSFPLTSVSGLELPFPEHASEEDLDALDRGDLVFVGGCYRYEWPNIVAIAWGVRHAGFIPVVVRTFPDLPGEQNRKKSFRLLSPDSPVS